MEKTQQQKTCWKCPQPIINWYKQKQILERALRNIILAKIFPTPNLETLEHDCIHVRRYKKALQIVHLKWVGVLVVNGLLWRNCRVCFPFFEVSLLVDPDRIMPKNTSLLLDAVTNSRRDWSAFNCSRYHYQQLNARKMLNVPIFPKLSCLSPL